MSKLVLTPSQERALAGVLESKQSVIKVTGPAGTGKTTTISALAMQLPKAVVVTPTNKAASVLRFKGIPAETIHKVFFHIENDRDALQDIDLGTSPTALEYETIVAKPAPLKFIANDKYNGEGELPDYKLAYAETVIVDEASMVPMWMLNALMRMSSKLILVGDERQLPPVNDRQRPRGYFNSIPADFVLTEQMRQTEPRLVAAIKMLETESGRHKALWEQFEQLPLDDFSLLYRITRPKIICFKNNTRHLLNEMARHSLGLSGGPQKGEPVIALKSTFTLSGGMVANGTEGVVESCELANSGLWLYVSFKDEIASYHFRSTEFNPLNLEINYAYAITAHKSQGSEYPVTLVVNEAGLINYISDMVNDHNEIKFQQELLAKPTDELREIYAHWQKHKLTGREASQRWAYTALTRGKKVYVTTTKGLGK